MLPKKGTDALSFHVVTSIDFVCRTRVVLIYFFIILAATCALDNCMEKQIVYKQAFNLHLKAGVGAGE